jgi:hypothetical protein
MGLPSPKQIPPTGRPYRAQYLTTILPLTQCLTLSEKEKAITASTHSKNEIHTPAAIGHVTNRLVVPTLSLPIVKIIKYIISRRGQTASAVDWKRFARATGSNPGRGSYFLP